MRMIHRIRYWCVITNKFVVHAVSFFIIAHVNYRQIFYCAIKNSQLILIEHKETNQFMIDLIPVFTYCI